MHGGVGRFDSLTLQTPFRGVVGNWRCVRDPQPRRGFGPSWARRSDFLTAWRTPTAQGSASPICEQPDLSDTRRPTSNCSPESGTEGGWAERLSASGCPADGGEPREMWSPTWNGCTPGQLHRYVSRGFQAGPLVARPNVVFRRRRPESTHCSGPVCRIDPPGNSRFPRDPHHPTVPRQPPIVASEVHRPNATPLHQLEQFRRLRPDRNMPITNPAQPSRFIQKGLTFWSVTAVSRLCKTLRGGRNPGPGPPSTTPGAGRSL